MTVCGRLPHGCGARLKRSKGPSDGQPSSGRREYEVVEDALRAYMRSDEAVRARQALRELLDRVAENDDLRWPHRGELSG